MSNSRVRTSLRNALTVSGLALLAVSMPARAWTGKPLAYVTNYESNITSVIDTGDNLVVAKITTTQYPIDAAVSSDGKRLYILGNNPESVVSVFTLNGKSTIPVTTITVGDYADQLAISPDGRRLYVTNSGSMTMSIIDTSSYTVISTITIGVHPEGVAVSPDGKWVYATDRFANLVVVVDAASNAIVKQVSVPNYPTALAVSPDGSRLYVASYFAISVIDVATNSVIATVAEQGQLLDLVIAPDGKHVYVADRGTGQVLVFSTVKNRLTAKIAIDNAQSLGITPDGKKLYVGSFLDSVVSVVDLETNEIVDTLGTLHGPVGIGIVPAPLPTAAEVGMEPPTMHTGQQHGVVVSPLAP